MLTETSIAELLAEYRGSIVLRELVPALYDRLRAIAAASLAREGRNHTLQPTELVHEAWLRFGGQVELQDRAHFQALAARLMRRILVDHARTKARVKRGGGAVFISAGNPDVEQAGESPWSMVEIDVALQRLSQAHTRKAQVFELITFGGLTYDEAGEVLGASAATVQRELRFARAWLAKELIGGKAGTAGLAESPEALVRTPAESPYSDQ